MGRNRHDTAFVGNRCLCASPAESNGGGRCVFLLLAALIMGANYLFVSKGLWIQITYPVLQLIFGYLGVER